MRTEQDSLTRQFIEAGQAVRRFIELNFCLDGGIVSTSVVPESTGKPVTITAWEDQPRGIFCEVIDSSHDLPGAIVPIAIRRSSHIDLMHEVPGQPGLHFRSVVDLARQDPGELSVSIQTLQRIVS